MIQAIKTTQNDRDSRRPREKEQRVVHFHESPAQLVFFSRPGRFIHAHAKVTLETLESQAKIKKKKKTVKYTYIYRKKSA